MVISIECPQSVMHHDTQNTQAIKLIKLRSGTTTRLVSAAAQGSEGPITECDLSVSVIVKSETERDDVVTGQESVQPMTTDILQHT